MTHIYDMDSVAQPEPMLYFNLNSSNSTTWSQQILAWDLDRYNLELLCN